MPWALLGLLWMVAPAWAEPSSLPVFLEEERCRLTGELSIARAQDDAPLRLPEGVCLEVTRPGRRFSEVRAGDARGLADNRALSLVCPVERERCAVKSPLRLTSLARQGAPPKTLRVQAGGVIEVLRRVEGAARVRVGENIFRVSLSALGDACPELAQRAQREETDAGGRVPVCEHAPPR